MTSWLAHYGVAAVFVLMMVDAVFPAASELVMVYAGALASGALTHQVDVLGWHATGLSAYLAVVLARVVGYPLGAHPGRWIADGAARLRCDPAVSIPHVDVRAQYAPLIPKLQEAFARTLETGKFIFGPEVEAFEREAAALLGTQETVSCANGTDAMVLVLDALEIGSGDEVICPAFTFYATAEAIARRGATPVFADIDPVSLNLEPREVERKITAKTKAIMPVHLFGRPAPDFSGFGLPV